MCGRANRFESDISMLLEGGLFCSSLLEFSFLWLSCASMLAVAKARMVSNASNSESDSTSDSSA